jgi:hypothetical protein
VFSATSIEKIILALPDQANQFLPEQKAEVTTRLLEGDFSFEIFRLSHH